MNTVSLLYFIIQLYKFIFVWLFCEEEAYLFLVIDCDDIEYCDIYFFVIIYYYIKLSIF